MNEAKSSESRESQGNLFWNVVLFSSIGQIAFRAAILEQENAILRAQILALREEVNTLQQMICSRPPVV